MKNTTFAINLRYLREKHDIEQKELVENLGFKSQSIISEWESGKRMPNIGVIHDIAQMFNVSIDDLINKDLTSVDDYFYNPLTQELANELHNNPNLRILLDASRKASPGDLDAVIRIVKSMVKD